MKGEIFLAQRNSESLRPEAVRPTPLVKFNAEKKAGNRRVSGKNSSSGAPVSLKYADTQGENEQLPVTKDGRSHLPENGLKANTIHRSSAKVLPVDQDSQTLIGPDDGDADGKSKQPTEKRDAPATPPTPPRDCEPKPLSSQAHLASQTFTSDSPSLQLVEPLVSRSEQELSVQSSVIGPQVLDDYCDKLWQSSSAPTLMQQSSVSGGSPLGGSQLLDMQSASVPSLMRLGPQQPVSLSSLISSNGESSLLGPSRLGGLQLFDNYCDERGQQPSLVSGATPLEKEARSPPEDLCLLLPPAQPTTQHQQQKQLQVRPLDASSVSKLAPQDLISSAFLEMRGASPQDVSNQPAVYDAFVAAVARDLQVRQLGEGVGGPLSKLRSLRPLVVVACSALGLAMLALLAMFWGEADMAGPLPT